MSGVSSPTPPQNSFMPPPVPVLSTTGVFMPDFWPNCSATAVENGNTVEEPTMRIWSRACAPVADASSASAAVVKSRRFMIPPAKDLAEPKPSLSWAGLLCADHDRSVTAAPAANGSNTEKVLPAPGSLAIARCPWWRRRMCLTMARPSPVPPSRRVRPLSTR